MERKCKRISTASGFWFTVRLASSHVDDKESFVASADDVTERQSRAIVVSLSAVASLYVKMSSSVIFSSDIDSQNILHDVSHSIDKRVKQWT